MNAPNSVASAIPEVTLPSTGEALARSSPFTLEHLSDSELCEGTRRLVARSNHHLAALLAHLAEVEARGLYRLRACSSLYTYCIYELRLSEDMAYRHARAAKLARRFPILFEQLAAGEIHLTGVLLLGPHLTEENHRAVLLRAKHRSKREIEKLVRQLDPLPDVPARVEPLGPMRTGLPMNNATWDAFVTSTNVIRELEPGQRPKDWANSVSEADAELEAPLLSEPKLESEPELAPQRYRVQFTASQQYVDLLEARAESAFSRCAKPLHRRGPSSSNARLRRGAREASLRHERLPAAYGKVGA